MKFDQLVWAIVGCVLLTLVGLNAAAVNRKFASWLSEPAKDLIVQCYSIPKGQK